MIWRCDLLPQYLTHKKEIDESIQRVLNSGRYILGTEVLEFEKEFAQYLGVNYGVGVGNATDGLILSLMALGIGRGDEVITTPFTAIPTISAIIHSGATPVFVDVSYETFLMDIRQIPKAISANTKAVMAVHIFGNVIDILELRRIVGDDMAIIEDASQSHGSKLNEIRTGSMGDIGVFSFYPTKNLGCYGDGGMVVTNDRQIEKKLRLLRIYGMIDKDHIVINGVNSRLDELQAAILRVKLKYLDAMNNKRNLIAKRYCEQLKKDLFIPQLIPDNVYTNCHVFACKYMRDRQSLMQFLATQNIQTNIYYPIPVHLQAANKYLGLIEGDLPISERLCKEVFALPMYPELSIETQDYIITSINNYVEDL